MKQNTMVLEVNHPKLYAYKQALNSYCSHYSYKSQSHPYGIPVDTLVLILMTGRKFRAGNCTRVGDAHCPSKQLMSHLLGETDPSLLFQVPSTGWGRGEGMI